MRGRGLPLRCARPRFCVAPALPGSSCRWRLRVRSLPFYLIYYDVLATLHGAGDFVPPEVKVVADVRAPPPVSRLQAQRASLAVDFVRA